MPAVASGRSSARHKFLPPERHAAVSAVPRLHQNFCFVNKHSSYFLSKNDNIGVQLSRKSRNLRRPWIVSSIRVWLRRALILLVLLALFFGVGAYFLYFHRETLPAALPHARVAPTIAPLKGLAACWVETGSTFTSYSFAMTGSSILVKHPAGDLLIDTGNSIHFDAQITNYLFPLRLNLKNLRAPLKPATPL